MFWVKRVKRGTIPVKKMKRGSEREGMRCEQGLLFWFSRPIGILGGGFGRDGVFLEKSSCVTVCFGGSDFC